MTEKIDWKKEILESGSGQTNKGKDIEKMF